jgi:hypothetical protein
MYTGTEQNKDSLQYRPQIQYSVQPTYLIHSTIHSELLGRVTNVLKLIRIGVDHPQGDGGLRCRRFHLGRLAVSGV